MKNDRMSDASGVVGTGTGGGGGGDIIMPGFNDANVIVHHGVEASGILGVVSVILDVDVFISGVDSTGVLGDLGIQIDESVTVKGTLATSFIGTATVIIPTDVTVSLTGVECNGFIGTVTIPGNFIYLDNIFPSTTVTGNTIEVRFTGIGFDQPNLQINISGNGVAILMISSVTSHSFSAIFQVNNSNDSVGTHAVTVQTDIGISGSRDFVVSPRK